MNEGKEILYLSGSDVAKIGILLATSIELAELSYREKAKGNIQNPPKAVICVKPECQLYAMPAMLENTTYFGMNWQSRFINNATICSNTGLIELCRKPTGIPLAIIEDSIIDSLSQSAIAGICAKYLANEASKTVAIIGCGDRAANFLQGVKLSIPGLKTALVYDYCTNRRDNWISKMEGSKAGDLKFERTGLENGVKRADVLITGAVGQGLGGKAAIRPGWLKAGCLIVSTNQDQQFMEGTIYEEVDTIVTDDLAQYQDKKELFVRDIQAKPIDLVQYITGSAEREREDEIIFCCLLGVSVINIMIAYDIFQRALGQGIGCLVPL
ncbi:MAG: hypothetical protein GX957_05825 [Clostridiaceae bacterium]|nr:hypothetical protein [Clostridiaceae bacterium]